MDQVASIFSSILKSRLIGYVETSEWYLNLAKQCMERVQKMTSLSDSTLKFNHGQCSYLAEKLYLAVEYACSVLEALNTEQVGPQKLMVHSLEVFKLLYALAMEVENVIQSCCRDAWTLAAVSLTDVSEHISSVGFNLELWRVAFYQRKTRADVDNIFRAEVEVVNEHASGDKETLLRDIHALLQRSKMSTPEYERASLLLERLERSRLTPTGESARSFQSSHSEIVMRSLIQMESLGKGSASTVYRATWLGAEFAKKTFYGPNFPDFEKEVSILTGLTHPNIAPLICYGRDKRECSIVMELMDGDLFTLMQRRLKDDNARDSPFHMLEAVDIMHQLGEGMHFLHERRIVHRDLKSMNVLVKRVKSSESKVEHVQIKVADFGLSRTKERSTTYSNQTMNVGTTRWMAPEIIRCLDSRGEGNGEGLVVQYPFKCDVYSFGMVCYEILSGDIPFSNISSAREVKKMMLDGGHPELPTECPELLKNLIERCWSLDASQRPKFGDICVDLRHLKYLLLSMSFASGNISPPLYKSLQVRDSTPSGSKTRVQSRSVGLENGATPFEQPSTRALAPAGEDVHRPLLQAGVHQEFAAQRYNLTQSMSDQLVHPPSGGARTSLGESIAAKYKPPVQSRLRPNYHGVRFRPDLGKWVAEISVAEWKAVDKKVWLGTFDTDVAAARAVDLARKLIKCGKKRKFNLPCPELDVYSMQIPSHLDLTNTASERMFKDVLMFIKMESWAYVASFEEAQKVHQAARRW